MKAAPKTMPAPKAFTDQVARIEDRIMARALALWHESGRGRRSALDAWLQAERELLPQKEDFPNPRVSGP